MAVKYQVGDRVHYAFAVGDEPRAPCKSRTTTGTVVAVEDSHPNLPNTHPVYKVYWDPIDRSKYPPSVYGAIDLWKVDPRSYLFKEAS